MDGNEGAPTAEKFERTFFVIDITKLKREDDQLVNAKLMFRPEEKYSKYEQLCSQLVGLSVCSMNLTGRYPQYLKLRNSGYAIKALGEDCIMGLSTRPDEPVSSVVQALKLIHDLFVFFYHSPVLVKKQAGENDWNAICTSMVALFSSILAYVEHDSKSIASMLSPLSYGKYTMQQSVEARFFLLSSRLLRHCQQLQPSISVGCIFHRNKIFCSHLPASLTEKLLLLVHTKNKDMCVELSLKSLFAEEISGHVWMLPVYLLLEEEEELKRYRRNMCDRSAVYSALRSSADALPLSSGASFFARFSTANPPRASKTQKSQASPPTTQAARRATLRRSMDVDRTYEDVTEAVEVLKLSKQQSNEKVSLSNSDTAPSLPPRTKPAAKGGATLPTKAQVGGAQPLAVSTPGAQPQTSSSHGPPPSPLKQDVLGTPQGGLNTTTYYSPNESFSRVVPRTPVLDLVTQAVNDVNSTPPRVHPGTRVGLPPTRGQPSQLDTDNDFMESSEIESLIRSKTLSRGCTPSDDVPPPLPPRMRDGDYMNSDALQTAAVGNIAPKEEPPEVTPLPASLVPPPQPSDPVPSVPPPQSFDLVSSVPPPQSSDPVPSVPPPQSSDPVLDVSPPQSSDVYATAVDDDDTCSILTQNGGGARASDGGDLPQAEVPPNSNDRVGDVILEMDNGVAVTFPGNLKTDTVIVVDPVPAQSDSALLPDDPRGDPRDDPRNDPQGDPQGNSSVLQQVSLDMEDKRTGAEDADYRSPMGSDGEEDEYVPSWALNREWGMASGVELKEQAGPKENGDGYLNEDSVVVAKEEDEGFANGEGEGEEMEVPTDHRVQPPVAHVLRPVAGTGEGSIPLVRKYLFLQNYMNTTVVLLADHGLENEQEQLRELFTTLLVHQSAIEETLTQHSEAVMDDKLPASRAMYRSVDRKCETVGSSSHGQFRHALRRAHQEYQNDPSLLQVTMSKEGRTTLSKCVLGREVYIHTKRNQSEDALQTLPTVESMIRVGRGANKDEDGLEPHGLFL